MEITKCKTKDGVTIRIDANASTLAEAKEAVINGAENIGLMRTEIFYMSLKKMPTINEAYKFYEKFINITGNRMITMRLLDLGADKALPYMTIADEENPQLGCRGIRFLLEHPELLKKPRWLVLNKMDLIAEDERESKAQELIKQLKWKGPVFIISAINKFGLKELIFSIAENLEQEE